jgi:electron transfer flavoprotein alpha subunit
MAAVPPSARTARAAAVPVAVVPVRDGVLPAGAAETAVEAGGSVLVVGSGCRDAAEALAGFAGRLGVCELGDFGPGTWARRLAGLVETARWVLLPASADGRDLAPRLAAVLGRPLVAGAIEVSDDGERPRLTVARCGGLVAAEVEPEGPFVATLQPGVRTVVRADRPLPTIDEVAAPEGDQVPDPVLLDVLPPDAATMDLAEAPRIVGGGAGLMATDGRSSFDLLGEVGEALGASMGATRVVTDAGLLPHSRQIGTTGVVVDPRLYLAFGISGAVQHTAGLGHPEHIVSVNTDPHCPMMAMADLAVVADAGETVRALAERLGVSEADASSGEPRHVA